MKIFIHFLDREILETVWTPVDNTSVCDELELSIRIALILGDTVFIPFSNYCESEISKKVLDRFSPISFLGLIQFVSSSPSPEQFFKRKEESHSLYKLPQIQDNIAKTIENGFPGNWNQREHSATADIILDWKSNVDKASWDRLYRITDYKTIGDFEKDLFYLPERLGEKVFVADNAVMHFSIQEGFGTEAKRLLNTEITRAYIKSYLDEFDCICFKDMTIRGILIDYLLPAGPYRNISYKSVLKRLSGTSYKKQSMLKYIKECDLYELLLLMETDEWKDLLTSLSLNKGSGILLNEKGGKNMKSLIVHGHANDRKLELKDYIQNTLKKDEPIILSEMPSNGKTIIEKFESLANQIDVVFVLLTPDDKYGDELRARQNVIFELGYSMGKFGRTSGRDLLLYEGKLDLPSDLSGVIYIDISDGIKKAGEQIRKELQDWL